MSKESGKPSDKEQGQQENDSVFDFLYHDPERIGSFLSQMDPGGHLRSYKRTVNVNDGTADAFENKVTGGAVVFKGATKATTSSSTLAGEGSESTYDPIWTNARSFLDFLTSRDFIQNDLSEANIGQFVLGSGDLSVLDFVMLKSMWKLPSMQHFIKNGASEPEGNRSERRSQSATQKPKSKPEPTEMDLALEMMEVLPHSIQGRMSTLHGQVWTTLREECLVTSPSDLVLKHGLTLPGEWNMLGILDAYPDHSSDVADLPLSGDMSDILPTFLATLTPVTRGILGRPQNAYAMTPLLIFREVQGQ